VSVLLLNASFEALRVVSINRAICLVVDGKADVVVESDEPMRSPSFEMKVPAVIKLRYFVKIPFRSRVPLNRRTLMARDNKICQFNDCTDLGNTIDHVQPRSRGGAHSWDNVVAACQYHNSKKDDKTIEELGWTIKRKPVAPPGNKWLIVGVTENREAWDPFLLA
jgi:5-methylcytosine-specific restriction endonuclease McrA